MINRIKQYLAKRKQANNRKKDYRYIADIFTDEENAEAFWEVHEKVLAQTLLKMAPILDEINYNQTRKAVIDVFREVNELQELQNLQKINKLRRSPKPLTVDKFIN